MELIEAIKGRRSIRKFTRKKVPKEVLDKVLEAAVWAPSAQNLQPWFLQVIQTDEDLSWLFATLGKTAFSHRKDMEERFKNHPEIVKENMEFVKALGGAHTVVLAYLYRPKYNDDVKTSVYHSIAAALENFCLAAYEQGLGTCWFEHVTEVGKEIHDHFAPDKGPLMGAVVVGYPAMDPKAPRRKDNRVEYRF